MVESINPDGFWRIEFTSQELAPIALLVTNDLNDAGVSVEAPAYKPPRVSTLGTPEIIITIIVTTAAKALIDAGLKALEVVLENQIDCPDVARAQVILTFPDNTKQRFPFSLRNIAKNVIHQTISQIIAAVDKF